MRAVCILLRVEELQVFSFLWKDSMYSASCRRAACNFLPVGKLNVFPFIYSYYSSFKRTADILLLAKSWRCSSFYSRGASILLPVEVGGILLHVEE